jgi:23S rRNA (guanosine2251-2'-O)-methyltransferase
LRPLVKRRCDFLARIPLAGRVASLNASAAAAVCIFEVVRQRAPQARQTPDQNPHF